MSLSIGPVRHVGGGYDSGLAPYLELPRTLEEARVKWRAYRDRLRAQRARLGEEMSPWALGQLAVAEQLVEDLERIATEAA